MQWKNHRLTTCAVTYALTGSFPATAIATASSMLPDVLELKLLKHRTLTHYPWIPIASAILMWHSMQSAPGYVTYILFFVLIGYIGHLVEDFLSKSGIPVLSLSRKVGCGLYVTHNPSEQVVALGIVAGAILYGWINGLFTQAYLMEAANNMAIFLTGMVQHYKR